MLLCLFPIYVFFHLFGAWLTLLGFFLGCSPLFFSFFYCMLAFIFCASLLYFLDDHHSQNHITVLLSNVEIREGWCILSYRDCCFPCLPHGADAFLFDWYRILPILNWQFLEVNYEINYCRNLPFGGRATRDSRDACSTKGIRAESPPTFIRGKRRKNQNGKGRRFAYFENEGSGVVYARGRY